MREAVAIISGDWIYNPAKIHKNQIEFDNNFMKSINNKYFFISQTIKL